MKIAIDHSTDGAGSISKLLTGACDFLAYPSASQVTIVHIDARLQLSRIT
ncbi:MAG: hypothetical protein P6H82_00765 [Candidatus Arsenophonus melophagi]|nr:hypothetical protein [Candidatus Arsenophonus melophagi]